MNTLSNNCSRLDTKFNIQYNLLLIMNNFIRLINILTFDIVTLYVLKHRLNVKK
jgi:hypothetical protein